jgi:hypothetical protein
MVAVRLLEVAAAVLVASAALEVWSAWDGPQFDASGSTPFGEPPVTERAWAVTNSVFRGPVATALGALLLAGGLAAVHRLRPVANATVLRWEIAAVATVGAAVNLLVLVAFAVALVVPMPFDAGGGQSAFMLTSAAWVLASLLLFAVLALAWWRLRVEVADLEDAHEVPVVEPVAEPEAGAVAGAVARPGWGPDLDDQDSADGYDGYDGYDGLSADLVGAERIEAVRPEDHEAILPLSPDGSTSNGYDEFFRRR